MNGLDVSCWKDLS